MNDIYAKIDMTNPGGGMGTVINTQVINPLVDFLDPNFTWIDINLLLCIDTSSIQIGCTYDGTNFHPIPASS